MTFPCLELAYEAGRAGGSAPAWLNAANEVAVAAFLEGRIAWSAIAGVVADTLELHEPTDLVEVEDVLDGRRPRPGAGRESVVSASGPVTTLQAREARDLP